MAVKMLFGSAFACEVPTLPRQVSRRPLEGHVNSENQPSGRSSEVERCPCQPQSHHTSNRQYSLHQICPVADPVGQGIVVEIERWVVTVSGRSITKQNVRS